MSSVLSTLNSRVTVGYWTSYLLVYFKIMHCHLTTLLLVLCLLLVFSPQVSTRTQLSRTFSPPSAAPYELGGRCNGGLYEQLRVKFMLKSDGVTGRRMRVHEDSEVLQYSLGLANGLGAVTALLDHQTIEYDDRSNRDELGFTLCLLRGEPFLLTLHSFIPDGLRGGTESSIQSATVCGTLSVRLEETTTIDEKVFDSCKTHEPARDTSTRSVAARTIAHNMHRGAASHVLDETTAPTPVPSRAPTIKPTRRPKPSQAPTEPPTSIPTSIPTSYPTSVPTPAPTSIPTSIPTSYPTPEPTSVPSATPTYGCDPTPVPSAQPSSQPTSQPSSPSSQPTSQPSTPTSQPSSQPSAPTVAPTPAPTRAPTRMPTSAPTQSPTVRPTAQPTITPAPSSAGPTAKPSTTPSQGPTREPTGPSPTPTAAPTAPTADSTAQPSAPSPEPSAIPSALPTLTPTRGGTLGSGGGNSTTDSSGERVAEFVQTDAGIGTLVGAGAVGVSAVASISYLLLRASKNLVRVPQAPPGMANIV